MANIGYVRLGYDHSNFRIEAGFRIRKLASCIQIILPSSSEGQEGRIPVLLANSDMIASGISIRFPVATVKLKSNIMDRRQ